jgi:hypothetical protein
MKMFSQGTRKPEASHSENGDMGMACCEELVELDDVQLATVVGGWVDHHRQLIDNQVWMNMQIIVNLPKVRQTVQCEEGNIYK